MNENMIVLYQERETNFTNNGIYVLNNICIKAEIEEELNGIYNLNLEFLIHNNDIWKEIIEDRIIKINSYYTDQLFRIVETRLSGRNKLKVFCRHIFFDLGKNYLEDIRAENRSGASALEYFLRNTIDPHPFTCSSDITDINTLYAVNMGFLEMLNGDRDNTFIARWGGEIEINNFNFSINKRRGQDRGVQIRYGKNMLSIERYVNRESIVTRLKPFGFDGITLDKGEFVESSLINKYPVGITTNIKFEDIKVKRDPNAEEEEGFATLAEAQRALREEARKLFDELDLDKPKTTYKVDFISLEDTDQYKTSAILERCWLGDTVTIIDDDLGINIKNRIVSYKFDCLSNRYIELVLGNKLETIFNVLDNNLSNGNSNDSTGSGSAGGDIGNGNIDIDKILQQAQENAKQLMEGGIVDSHVVVRKNEILIMEDTTDIAQAKRLIRANRNGIFCLTEGYHSTPVTAVTADGINANCITFGELNGRLIMADTIEANALTVNAVKKIREDLVTQAQLKVEVDKINLKVSSIEQTKLYQLLINPVNGTSFRIGVDELILKAQIQEQELTGEVTDISNTIDPRRVTWIRKSSDEAGDIEWNKKYENGARQIKITRADLVGNTANFACQLHDGKGNVLAKGFL
ncbi:TPA: phage tail spike protein [Clostridium perfringens]|uniref:phage tail spike protein n=1 Tax=Clostridium perfringens TaxID=1502 RepID=UPI0024BD3C1F|nr:phage tail spike protein [Clostridium perfringens]MDK0658179.1 phage tail spike protein [Clostridium perfringens]MDM0661850.1 phage tail spike protein [Clostridium perfringens]